MLALRCCNMYFVLIYLDILTISYMHLFHIFVVSVFFFNSSKLLMRTTLSKLY